jgi:large subunit ribosomal protein L4
METSYYSTDGSVLGKFPLAEKLFDQKVNEHLLWEVVRYYQANQRQGTVSTKTRAEVRAVPATAAPDRRSGSAAAPSLGPDRMTSNSIFPRRNGSKPWPWR